MRCKSHVRFGGRPRETDPEQSGHRVRGRPNTRHVSVDRLDAIARALDTYAHAILAEVDQRRYGAITTHGTLVIDLARLAASTRPDIAPVARWAAIRVAELGNCTTKTTTELSLDAIDTLARMWRLDLTDLVLVLRDYTA